MKSPIDIAILDSLNLLDYHLRQFLFRQLVKSLSYEKKLPHDPNTTHSRNKGHLFYDGVKICIFSLVICF